MLELVGINSFKNLSQRSPYSNLLERSDNLWTKMAAIDSKDFVSLIPLRRDSNLYNFIYR